MSQIGKPKRIIIIEPVREPVRVPLTPEQPPVRIPEPAR